MQRTEPKSFAAIFDEAIERVGATSTLAAQRASYAWPEVVGPGVSRHTLRRHIDAQRRLHVYITSAPLRQELAFLRERLRERLNQAAGTPDAITDIIFH